jgi:hypothetical protein
VADVLGAGRKRREQQDLRVVLLPPPHTLALLLARPRSSCVPRAPKRIAPELTRSPLVSCSIPGKASRSPVHSFAPLTRDRLCADGSRIRRVAALDAGYVHGAWWCRPRYAIGSSNVLNTWCCGRYWSIGISFEIPSTSGDSKPSRIVQAPPH